MQKVFSLIYNITYIYIQIIYELFLYYCFVLGEVLLHRLSWQRVWCLRPEHESISVMALRWRPDGKLLAVAYSTGTSQYSILNISK